MWRLNEPTKDQLDNYCSLLEADIIRRLDNNATKKVLKIVKPELHALLISRPDQLVDINKRLMTKLVPSYSEKELLEYLNVKPKSIKKLKKDKNVAAAASRKKYDALLTKLQDWMGYETLIVGRKDVSYQITQMKRRNTCTYCNRNYVPTIETVDDKNNPVRVVRPHLDHWFSKELYPLLSMSFYNLIPSRPICNSSVKGNEVFTLGKHIHPYCDDSRDFTFLANPGGKSGWSLVINRKALSIEDTTIKALHLDEIYVFHSDKEVKDIMEFADANSEDYLKTLYEKVLHDLAGSKTPQEVYRMLFGTELDEDQQLDRPLSKMKHDLLKQIGVIK